MDTRMNVPAEARYAARPAPRLAAGLLALAVHAAFVVLLVFGVSWQTQRPEPVMVDVWAALPPIKPAAPAPRPQPEPPQPIAPRAKPEPPEPAKPDIALEKKREAEQLRKMLEAEDQARAKAAREKQLAEQKKRELQRQLEEEAMTRRMADQEAAAQAEATRVAAARAAASRRQAEASRVMDEYAALIRAKVHGNTRLPDNLKGNPEVRFKVKVLPTGEVQAHTLRKTQSSGNPAYDDAVERAILKSSPLPLPKDREARDALILPELSFTQRPQE
jgi:colicin import membrane protein